jgi:diacylglycerol O-acyltransferase / wax synthase
MKGNDMTNVIDLVDQAAFLGEQATGATSVIQCVWKYDGAVDLDGLRRFHHHLQRGRLSRRIEQSPLPFGRHRWISPNGTPALEIVETPRPREDFDAWLREQANTPLDLENGPGWHLAALPFTDGGTGVTLVVSHAITDGGGLCLAIADATAGRDDEIAWPTARSGSRLPTLLADIRQFLRDIPNIGRAVAALARLARSNGHADASGKPAAMPADADEFVDVPMATTVIELDGWDARARAIGATSNTLLVGVAGRVAERLGRVASDGSIDVTMPVSERVAGDTRANAITNVDFTVNPPASRSDLSELRGAVKQALVRNQEVPNERFAALPLTPLVPKWLVRKMVSVSAGSANSVVSSNLGDIDPAVIRPDGTDADYFVIKTMGPGLTKATMHRVGGLLVVLSGRMNGKIFISVLSYQLNQPNSDELLQQTLSDTLSDFSLAPTSSTSAAA